MTYTRRDRAVLLLTGVMLTMLLPNAGCSSAAPHAKGTTALPLIVAHRGASFDAPENTRAAFRLAIEQRADAIEGDFHLTRDGALACMHDADAKRTAGVDRRIVDMALAEFAALDAGIWKGPAFAGERPPTLADVLALLPNDRQFLIEVKCGPEAIPVLRQDVERSGVDLRQLRLIAFNADVIAASKRLMPGLKAYWLTGYKNDDATGQLVPSPDQVLETLRRCKADGLDTNANLEVLTPAFVRSLRDAGLEFHAWTVDDPAVARRLVSLGVDSITTNRPREIREALEASRDADAR